MLHATRAALALLTITTHLTLSSQAQTLQNGCFLGQRRLWFPNPSNLVRQAAVCWTQAAPRPHPAIAASPPSTIIMASPSRMITLRTTPDKLRAITQGSAGALPVTDGTITTTTAASTAVPDAAASPAGTTALGSAAPNPAIPGAVGSPAQSVPTPAVATAGSPATQPAVQPPAVPIMPTEAAVNGSSTRQWVNEKLTQHVLDAMKEIARSR